MPFAGAAHRFREDVHLDRLLTSVRLRHAGRADEQAGLDVGKRRLDDRDHDAVVHERDFQLGAVARFDDIDRSLHAIDRAAHADGILRVGGGAKRGEQQRRETKRASNRFLHVFLPEMRSLFQQV